MRLVADIGGTNMRIAVASGAVLGKIAKMPTPADPNEGIAQIVQMCRDCARDEPIEKLVGGIAADTIGETAISGARNLHSWEGVNVIGELSRNIGARVVLVNDVVAVGLGESVYGAGKGSASLAYVTVSTGVGAVVIQNGKVVASGAETRMLVEGTDIEYLISGTAVRKIFGISPKEFTSEEGLLKLADTLAKGLQTLAARWSIDTIVLGGSMIAGVNAIPLARAQQTLSAAIGAAACPALKMEALGDNGGLWGGLVLLSQL